MQLSVLSYTQECKECHCKIYCVCKTYRNHLFFANCKFSRFFNSQGPTRNAPTRAEIKYWNFLYWISIKITRVKCHVTTELHSQERDILYVEKISQFQDTCKGDAFLVYLLPRFIFRPVIKSFRYFCNQLFAAGILKKIAVYHVQTKRREKHLQALQDVFGEKLLELLKVSSWVEILRNGFENVCSVLQN